MEKHRDGDQLKVNKRYSRLTWHLISEEGYTNPSAWCKSLFTHYSISKKNTFQFFRGAVHGFATRCDDRWRAFSWRWEPYGPKTPQKLEEQRANLFTASGIVTWNPSYSTSTLHAGGSFRSFGTDIPHEVNNTMERNAERIRIVTGMR